MFSTLATLAVGSARATGKLLGRELDVIVSDHKIKLKMVKPSESEGRGYAWDDSQFTSGNIHIQGYANSLKPEPPDEEDEDAWILSERYKVYMENKLQRDIIDEGSEDEGLTLFHVLVVLSTLQAASLVIMLWFTF